jgi:hypothetical protein
MTHIFPKNKGGGSFEKNQQNHWGVCDELNLR